MQDILSGRMASNPRNKQIASIFPIGEIPGGGVTGGVNNLLDYIKANPGKKSKEIKAALNLPQRTLERWLKELREQKKIKFQGAPKTGGYYRFDETDPKPSKQRQ